MPFDRALVLALGAAACIPDRHDSGAGEPIRVVDPQASFHRGELPADDDRDEPRVVYAAGVGSVVTAGQGRIPYNGLATAEAHAVAVAFPGFGTGYWVVPVDGPDVTQQGQLLFDLVVELTPEVPYGLQDLAFVALDGDRRGGPRYTTTLCVLPEVAAGNYWACDPAVTPQNAIVSLRWDTAVDLDLVVVTPEGKVVSSKTPSSAVATGPVPSEVVSDPSTGSLTRDSNADCRIDGVNLESLVFPGEPPAGAYAVYARLHQACGRPSVNFVAELLRRVEAEDGSHPVETTTLGVGTLLSTQVTRGGALGTLIAVVDLP